MAPPVGSDGNTFGCPLGLVVVDYTSSIRGKRGALGAKQPTRANSLSIKPCFVAGRWCFVGDARYSSPSAVGGGDSADGWAAL